MDVRGTTCAYGVGVSSHMGALLGIEWHTYLGYLLYDVIFGKFYVMLYTFLYILPKLPTFMCYFGGC